jgi:predicted ArsR family transcriptional regulator
VADEISRDVDQFIRDHINSVEQLEVLLLLMENAQQEWSAAQVAQKLYRQPVSIAGHMDALRAAGLLTKTQGKEILYRYAPHSRTMESTVSSLDRAYRERKDTVIRLIFSRPPDALRSFSDAFKFRKND